MASSPLFARLREHVLPFTASVPEGRICTHQSIGGSLDLMPRHVAYLLSRLEDHEKFVYPWHRVVSSDASLGTPKNHADGTSQAELQRAEGILVGGNKIASGFKCVFIGAEQLPSGLARQQRPADAPLPKPGRKVCPPRGRTS